MGVLRGLLKGFANSKRRRRTWTPGEVRELIDQRKLADARAAAELLSEHLTERAAERACLLGEIGFLERKDDEAEFAFREALRAAPGLPAAHYGWSLLLAERKDFANAVRHAFFAHSADRNDPRFLAQLGYCHLQLQNFEFAEGPLRRATLLAPHDSYAWNNLGIILRLKAEFSESKDCFQRALTLRPDNLSAAENLAQLDAEAVASADAVSDRDIHGEPSGILAGETESQGIGEVRRLEREQNLRVALDRCEQWATAHHADPAFALELNRLYHRAGDPQSGIDALEAFLSAHPDAHAVLSALGLAKLEMRDVKAAEALLRRALEQAPEAHSLLIGLGQALVRQERFADAAAPFERAIALKPEDRETRALLAANLVNKCQYEEGLQACLELQAEGLQIPALGIVLAFLGRFPEALTALDDHLAHHPNDPNVRFHRGTVRLLQQDFEGGWDDYAYRGFSMSENFRVLPFPLWNGEPLHGKKIVLLAEQGLGDQVMFASCLPDLLALEPSEVVVEAIHRIAPTIARSFPQCRVIPTNQSRQLEWVRDCPDMDFYAPLGDLPRHFRRQLAAFPTHDGFLIPDPDRVRFWRGRLEASGPGPYVGISWKGGTEGTRTTLRSISPLQFQTLQGAGPSTWICLQYGAVGDMVDQAAANGFPMKYWPDSISDLDEFAALVKALDLVITVCNTTVHYAGAVGTPVWIVAPKIPEWRYGAQNGSLPWYPRSRIYRQPDAGDWTATFARVGHDLSDWHATR